MRAENIFPPQAVILDSPGQLELKLPWFSLFAVYYGEHLPVMQEYHRKCHPVSSAWIYGCEGRSHCFCYLWGLASDIVAYMPGGVWDHKVLQLCKMLVFLSLLTGACQSLTC